LNRLNLLAFIFGLICLTGPDTVHAADPEITVSVLAFRGDELAKERWEPTT
jgi:hypothetical protein